MSLREAMRRSAAGYSRAWASWGAKFLVFFLLIFCSGFFIQGNLSLYFNLSGLLIVVGGTLAAALIGFRIERLLIVWRVLSASMRVREKDPTEIVEALVDLSLKSKFKGILSLQEDERQESSLFLRRALGYLVDDYPVEQIRELLVTEMQFFQRRRQETERVLRTMAEISPSFGLVGSVVGLIAMLGGVGDTSVIMRTVPIALTSTLYGILFANLLFLPLAVKVRERTDHELLLQKIILEGAVAIAAKMHPRILEVKLKSFLTPSQREGRLVSLARIERKFHIRPSAEATFDANGEAFSVEIGAEGREASGRAGQGEAN